MSHHNESIEKLRDLVSDVKIAMMTTKAMDGSLQSRPMYTQDSEIDGDLWFVTGRDSGKVDQIEANAQVNIAYSEPASDTYVSVSGRATVGRDEAKLDELWNPMMRAWFPDGKDDPNITLVKVDVESAEYWDVSSSKLVQLYGFAKAALTGESAGEETSDHGTIQM